MSCGPPVARNCSIRCEQGEIGGPPGIEPSGRFRTSGECASTCEAWLTRRLIAMGSAARRARPANPKLLSPRTERLRYRRQVHEGGSATLVRARQQRVPEPGGTREDGSREGGSEVRSGLSFGPSKPAVLQPDRFKFLECCALCCSPPRLPTLVRPEPAGTCPWASRSSTNIQNWGRGSR